MRSIALNLMFCSYSEEYFEAREDKDLFRMHQWLIKQKNQGLCLYKTHYWRRLGLAVLLLHSRSVLKVSTEVWSYMQSIHFPNSYIRTCSLIQNTYCTCTQALLSEVNSQPLFIHACRKHCLSRNSAHAPSLTVNTYSSCRSTPDLTLFPFAAGSRNEWNMNSTVSKLIVYFWVKHASLLHLASQRKQWYSSSLTERFAVSEKWTAKWSLGVKLTFEPWCLPAEGWRQSDDVSLLSSLCVTHP